MLFDCILLFISFLPLPVLHFCILLWDNDTVRKNYKDFYGGSGKQLTLGIQTKSAGSQYALSLGCM